MYDDNGGAVVYMADERGVGPDGSRLWPAERFKVLKLSAMSSMPGTVLRDMLGWLEQGDTNPAYAYIAELVGEPDTAVGLLRKEIKTRPDKTGKALAALKRKGLHADTAEGLRQLIDKKRPWVSTVEFDSLLDMACGMYGVEVWDCALTERDWRYAIELVMIHRHPVEFYDHASSMQWGLFVEQDYRLIWMLVYLCGYAHTVSAICQENRATVDQAHGIVTMMDGFQEDMSRCLSEKDALEARLAEAEAALKSAEKPFRSRIAELEAENRKLRRAVKSLEAAERASMTVGAASEPSGDDAEFDLDAGMAATQEEHDSVEGALPDTGVLFVGGHPSLQAKLRAMHPKWKFMAPEASYKSLDDNMALSVIYVFTKHLSHKLYDKVKRTYPDVPIVYVRASNLDKLETNMRLALRALVDGKERDGDAGGT